MLDHVTFAKYKYLLRRLVGPFRGLREAASKIDVLCEEETTIGDPAIYLEGQIDKIIGVQQETTWEHELSRIRGGRRTHASTRAFTATDVSLLDGTFYKERYKSNLTLAAGTTIRSKTTTHIESAALASSVLGVKYFGHWLHDDCVTYCLAEKFGRPLSVRTPEWKNKPEYAEIFDQDWSPTARAVIDELIFFEDFSQNSLKRARYEALRNVVRETFTPTNPGGLVYLKRGQTSARRILNNEDRIIAALADKGVAILTAEETPLTTTVRTLLDASILITIEGSQQNHGLYTLSTKGAVVTLQPPDRFNNFAKDWLECLGMQYGFIVGDVAEDGFEINIDDLLRTIDLVKTRLDNNA